MRELRLSFRNLCRHGLRTVAVVGMVMFGVAGASLVGGFITFLFENYRETTIRTYFGHVQIAKRGYFDDGVSDRSAYLLSPDVVRPGFLRSLPHVVKVAPKIHFAGLIGKPGTSGISFIGEGVDPAEDFTLSHGLILLSGRQLRDSGANEVMLGRGLASNLGVSVGDTVVLLVTTTTKGINAIELRVVGIFSSVTKAYDDVALKIPIVVAQELVKATGAHTWSVLLDATMRTDAVVDALRSNYSDSPVEVKSWLELSGFYRRTAELLEQQLGVLNFIIAAVILLGVTNSAAMNVLERRSEVGVCLALGMRRSKVMRTFVVEGALIGVLGAVLGITLAVISAALVSQLQIHMSPAPGMAHGYIAQVRITPAVVAEAAALGIFCAVAGSLYPAWKASRMSIVDALRTSQ